MKTTLALTADITTAALTFVIAPSIAVLTVLSTVFVYLHHRDPQRRHRTSRLIMAILFTLTAVFLLIFWTVLADQSSPSVHTPGPSTVEGQ